MAGDWIKMRADLFTHPKVVRMSSALKADVLRTVGGLMSAWCLFDAHSEDGRLDGYTTETLDNHLRWPGFSAAMISVEWLDDDGESLVLPRFDTHNGESAKRRAQDADRKRADRKAQKASASKADKLRTREEERREELSSSDRSLDSPPLADTVGQFEGHAEPKPGINPAAPHAIALNALGFRCTTMTPALVEFARAGGTVEHLREVAALPECAGKPAAYLLRIAHRELVEKAAPVVASERRAPPVAPHNPGGVSPRLSPEEEAARKVEALAAMQAQMRDLGHAA